METNQETSKQFVYLLRIYQKALHGLHTRIPSSMQHSPSQFAYTRNQFEPNFLTVHRTFFPAPELRTRQEQSFLQMYHRFIADSRSPRRRKLRDHPVTPYTISLYYACDSMDIEKCTACLVQRGMNEKLSCSPREIGEPGAKWST